MEEIQKKTRKVTKSDKNEETKKTEAVTKKSRTREAAGTKKETKTTKKETAKKETKAAKSPKTESAKTTTKKATTSAEKGEAKTSKARSTKKEANTSKTPVVKKDTKTSKKDANTPKANSTKKVTRASKTKSTEEPKIEEIQNREEPKLTIIHEKKEQPKQSNNSAPKKQSKQVDASAPKKEKKTKKAKKNYIDISVGAIICVAIIIGLIILNVKLGTHAYNVITKNELTNSDTETENDISVTQEVGNVLSNSDELVAEMKERITFAPNVTASIYDAETFSTNTISNDLKLILGWSMTEDSKKLRSKNENNQEIEAIEKETMAENIKNILGPNVKYKDKSFENTKNSTFSVYSQNQGPISYSNGIYTSIVSENTENEMAPLIYQEIQKVVKYTDKVVVYVKVAYMDVEEGKYIVYKDFTDGKFEEKLLEMTAEELFEEESFNQYTGEGTVTIDANTSLDDIRNQLDTYKYTFSLDEETGEYYLTKFNKALSMQ